MSGCLLVANAGRGLSPMIDEIRRHCALLLSEDFATHSAAYLWLRESKPFSRVVERFREYDLNLFDVAALLAPGINRPMSAAALKMLDEEVGRQENALRDTVAL
jgi:hypothetical protein